VCESAHACVPLGVCLRECTRLRVCVCEHVIVCERKRKCVCVCVCERERERSRFLLSKISIKKIFIQIMFGVELDHDPPSQTGVCNFKSLMSSDDIKKRRHNEDLGL
jgi:hypothetical protein